MALSIKCVRLLQSLSIYWLPTKERVHQCKLVNSNCPFYVNVESLYTVEQTQEIVRLQASFSKE